MILQFEPYAYTCKTFRQLLEQYLYSMRMSDLVNRNIASKIEEYLHFEENKKFFKEAEKIKSAIAKQLSFISPISLTVSGRKKAFESYLKKLDKASPDIDSVRDEYAFRVIVSSHLGENTAINFCYVVAQVLMDYFLNNSFILTTVSAKTDGEIQKDVLKQITIPDESSIPNFIKDYMIYFKDYIQAPKSNGYQGLHIIAKDSTTGRYFEFQIRTSQMHIYAEFGGANHTEFKKKSNRLSTLDLSKIRLDGFSYDETTKQITEDINGIIVPLSIGETFKHVVDNDPIDWLPQNFEEKE